MRESHFFFAMCLFLSEGGGANCLRAPQELRRTRSETRWLDHSRVPRVRARSLLVLLDGVLERRLPVPHVRRHEEGTHLRVPDSAIGFQIQT